MDTITQGLLGAVTAQLGFRQKIGRDASWVAAGSAVLADLDILARPLLSISGQEGDDFVNLVIHRGINHSLLMVPVLALVVSYFWWYFRKKSVSFAMLYTCVFIAMLSHPLLDWCTTYGTQLFAPVTNRRYALNVLPIVDFIYTPILIVTLTICYLVRKVKRNSAKITLNIGWTGLGLSLIYIFMGFLMRQRAIQRMKHPEIFPDVKNAQNLSVDYHAYPQIGSIFIWRGTKHHGQEWTVARLNMWLKASADGHHWNRVKNMDNQWIQAGWKLEEVKKFQWFAANQLRAVYYTQNSQHIVEFHDMRYGRPAESVTSLWFVRVGFDAEGNLTNLERVNHFDRNY